MPRQLGFTDSELANLPPQVADRIRIMQENLENIRNDRPKCPHCGAHFYQCNVCGFKLQKGVHDK